jgi:two-component system NtrC family sensor kinase
MFGIMNVGATVPSDSAVFVLREARSALLRQHRARTILLLTVGALTVIAGLVGTVRKIAEFQRLDFRTAATERGLLVISVAPRGGASRAGIVAGDTIIAVSDTHGFTPVKEISNLETFLYARRVSVLTLQRGDRTREVDYYPPPTRVDVRYLLVAFAAMFTLFVAGAVYIGHATAHAGRFLALAEALFAALVIPLPANVDASWQLLLLLRDFGRLALPALLVVFFATFPQRTVSSFWLAVAFIPSFLVAAGRTALGLGLLPPVVGNILLPATLEGLSAMLVVGGVVAALALGVRSYVRSRDDPTRRRQVEWVALGAAAGFTPYLLLSIIPQLAGAELEVLTWVSLLPLALVPLGVASSLLEFRLWDLEDIARHVISTGIAVLLGGISFALLNVLVTRVGFALGNWRNLVAVAGGVLLVALALPARRLLLEGLERFQYRERLAARRALTTFAEEAAGLHDSEILLSRLGQLVQEAMAVERVVTYLIRGDRLHPLPERPELPVLSPADLQGSFPSEPERPLQGLGLWHRFRLERDGRVLGLLYCGRRHGDLPLGHGQRRLVSALAAQAALALENTLLLTNLRQQVEEHRLLEDYLERIFQLSPTALLICSAAGTILRANQRAASLLACEATDLVGKQVSSFVQLPPEWREQLPIGIDGVQLRFTVGGELRAGLLSTSALEMESGRFDGRVVSLDDISEQLRLEQRLAQQERLAALGRLAGGLAHEVNTPVTGIASYAQLLHELTPSDDPRAPLVTKLEEQSFRVARIVTNLLELARPAGFERQSVDIAAVVQGELAKMRGETERAGVETTFLGAGSLVIKGNRVQLELVVHNLLRNAVQASTSGGQVELRLSGNETVASLEVADTGPGVPSQLGDRIFEPFVSTRHTRGGTGLGLAITRDIVVAHGGTIAITPNTPRGTVVRVDLPLDGGEHAHSDH